MSGRILWKTWIGIYIAISAVFSNCLFLYGFFPSNKVNENGATLNDVPSNLHNISLSRDVFFNRSVGRLVFIVIDAFRHDFIHKHMPYTMNLINSKKGSLLTVRCHPPTATLPRVKALMTGTVPNYIDVILNLGSQHSVEDSLIHQAVAKGMHVVFYGDELWLELFPEKFIRSEGITPFFVSDYTEVDENVTRHIPAEMKTEDWDILVLHYLGLDHIGHLAGPSSTLVPPKLKEMDEVVQTVHKGLQDWDNKHPDKQSLMVVVGDHGMHDSGSHGGATLGEILVSLVLIGEGATTIPPNEASQIDIPVTLAILLGLPIPKCSLGILIPQALGRLTPKEYLYALYYNAHHIAQKFVAETTDVSSQAPYEQFLAAQNLHATWLWSGEGNMELLQKVATLYMDSSRTMSHSLVDNLVEFDYLAMSIACIILIQLVMLSYVYPALCYSKFWTGQNRTGLALTGVALLSVGLILCSLSTHSGSMCSCTFPSLIVPLLIFMFLSSNTWFLSVSMPYIQISKLLTSRKINTVSTFLHLGSILHIASLGASSLIEEEHQTWYFLWVTLVLLILLSIPREQGMGSLRCVTQVLILLVCHRVLRKLNQTGDKWASLPDISDWLGEPHNRIFLSFIAITGLIGTWISIFWLGRIICIVDSFLYVVCILCILLYRATVDEIVLPFSYSSRGTMEVNLFWLFFGIILIRQLHRARCCVSLNELLSIFASHWLLIASLLMRPHNIILVPSLVFTSTIIHSLSFQTSDCTLAHVWIGTVGFFYQGNSNNLASIDVAAGYVGADDRQLWVAGVLVAIHTLAAPVGAILLLWAGLTRAHALQRKKVSSCEEDFEVIDNAHLRRNECILYKELDVLSTSLRTILIQRLLPLSTYCILAGLQSHHLFVWTVFAPKLIYESVISFIILTVIILGHTLILISSKGFIEKRKA